VLTWSFTYDGNGNLRTMTDPRMGPGAGESGLPGVSKGRERSVKEGLEAAEPLPGWFVKAGDDLQCRIEECEADPVPHGFPTARDA
jgi:hypothetical protein